MRTSLAVVLLLLGVLISAGAGLALGGGGTQPAAQDSPAVAADRPPLLGIGGAIASGALVVFVLQT